MGTYRLVYTAILSRRQFFYYVNNHCVDIFVDSKYRDICRALGYSFEELIEIFKKENTAFYKYKKSIFRSPYKSYTSHNFKITHLQELFKLPVLPTESPLEICLKNFNMLSDLEKAEFLKKIDISSANFSYSYSVCIEHNN